jgi:beta-fructofuranosidase
MKIDYYPDGMSMWDTWGLTHNGLAHMFYLQFYGQDSTRDPADADWLGHATSPDLLHWTERPLAIGPGPAGGPEDMQPWTGSLVEHAGTFYFYYTMRSSVDGGYGQKIGLATSQDLEHWERYPGNPVLVPDDRWYVSYERPLAEHTVDCRDMVVIPDPNGEGWLGYFAARVHPGTAPETAAIGLARSTDLIHWEQSPPVFVPGNISAIEVPDVYQIDGTWYLTCLTGNRYGNRGFFSDPTVILGTIYAVAERAEGPYYMHPDDNVLLGGQTYSAYTCRTMEFHGERVMFYTQSVPKGPATVSPPMALRTLPGKRLRLGFSEHAKGRRQRMLIAPGQTPSITQLPFTQFFWALNGGTWQLQDGIYHGEAQTGWQTADLGIGAEAIEFSASVTLHEGAAVGFLFRPDTHAKHSGSDQKGDFIFYLDAEQQQVAAARLPAFIEPHVRRLAIEHGRTYALRLCIRPPRFELFVDDILVLQGALAWLPTPAPSVGLFVDRGIADVSNLELYELG